VSRAIAGLVLAVTLLAAGPARADTVSRHHRDRCRSEDCDDRGSGCTNFCDNVIVIPDPRGGDGQQPKGSVTCAVPVPWHCDQPKGFIPPNPSKIPQQIADFIKVVGDFVQSVIRFAV
jgi:hypothetical protein